MCIKVHWTVVLLGTKSRLHKMSALIFITQMFFPTAFFLLFACLHVVFNSSQTQCWHTHTHAACTTTFGNTLLCLLVSWIGKNGGHLIFCLLWCTGRLLIWQTIKNKLQNLQAAVYHRTVPAVRPFTIQYSYVYSTAPVTISSICKRKISFQISHINGTLQFEQLY